MKDEEKALRERISKHKAFMSHLSFAMDRVIDWNGEFKADMRGFNDTNSFRKWWKAVDNQLKEDRLALLELQGD